MFMQVGLQDYFRLGVIPCLLMCVAAGCGSSGPPVIPGMVGIQGQVTVDGAPVPVGRIVLIPASSGTNVPGGEFAGSITNGRYLLELNPGSYRVEIFQYGESVNEQVPQLLPAEFNTESTLKAEVPSSGSAPIDFALQSRSKK